MARIRTIKPTFWKDEELGSLSRDTRLLFIGLWNFADAEGRLKDSPIRLKVEVFPYDEDITSSSINDMLDSLAAKGFIMRYKDDSETPVIQVVNWKKHQRITGTEASMESSFGAPEGMETKRKQLGNNLETHGNKKETPGNNKDLDSKKAEIRADPEKTHDKKEECVKTPASDFSKSQSTNNQQVEDLETTWKQLGNNYETTRTTGREGKGKDNTLSLKKNKGLGEEGIIEKNNIEGERNFSHQKNSQSVFSENPEELAGYAWSICDCHFSEKFRDVWIKLLKHENWRDKNATSVEMALSQLMEYQEEFAIEKVKLAIVNGWKACIYPETTQEYAEWQKSKNVTRNGSGKSNNSNGLGGANAHSALAQFAVINSLSGNKGHA